MRKALLGDSGGFTAPDQKAALVGYEVLKSGGTAVEAMVAAAATIASIAVPPSLRISYPANAAVF